MEDDLNSMEDFLDKFILEMIDLSLGAFIWISSGTTLDLRGLDIAEEKEKMFVFTISLLGTTIQDMLEIDQPLNQLC